jgi:hypothetical protein
MSSFLPSLHLANKPFKKLSTLGLMKINGNWKSFYLLQEFILNMTNQHDD